MANGGRIEYSVGFKADATSLNNIKSQLAQLKNLTENSLTVKKGSGYAAHEKALNNLKESVGLLENALDKAFNKDLGTLNVAKFNKELQKLDLHKIEKDMQAAGAAGVTAFRNVAAQALTTNMQLKQTHTFIDKIATTLSNTIKWNLASSAVNSFTGQVQQAYGYVKNLDSSLNDIRIVTGKATDEMAEFAKLANKTAQDLGKGTTDYTNAALIYYQQGLEESEVQARAEVTLKAANVTGQSTNEVSEQLTAVWNGYKVSSEEAELYVDKLAAVAATTASDLEELSTGMSKVASAASTMGVDIDQLNAQLATIVSITRQAPESVGTALKTIYARMGDIEAGLDSETTLGNYTEEMANMGFNVLDMNGNLRDMGEVIEEIGSKWTTLSREQQIALSQTVAGTRQYNNLLALFDNWDMYTEALNTSADAAGTLQKQQDIYMESTAAHLEKLDAKWEDFYDSILDNNTINKATDLLGGLVDGLTDVVDGLGGGVQTFELLGTVATSILSKKIAGGISTFIKNIQNAKNNVEQFKAQLNTVEMFKGADDAIIKQMANMRDEAIKYSAIMDAERQNEATAHIQTINRLNQQQAEWEESKKNAQAYYSTIVKTNDIIDFSKKTDNQVDRDYITTIQNQLRDWKENLKVVKTDSDNLFRIYARTNNQEPINRPIEDMVTSLRQFKDQLIDNQIYLGQYRDELGDVSADFENFYQAMEDSGNLDFTTPEAMQKIQALRSVLSKIYPELEADLKKFEKTSNQAWGGLTENIKDEIEAAESSWNNFMQGIQTEAGINAVINLANDFNQLIQVYQSIKNIGNIWSDETLSDGEKFKQIISNLATTLPMAILSIKDFNKSINEMAVIFGVASKKIYAALGVIGLVLIAVQAGIEIWDYYHTSMEEAIQSFEESKTSYETSKEELKQINEELINVTKSLEELLALEDKTYVEEEEIKKLQQQQQLLEAQLKVKEKIIELDRKESTSNFLEAFNKGAYQQNKEIELFYPELLNNIQSNEKTNGQSYLDIQAELGEFELTEERKNILQNLAGIKNLNWTQSEEIENLLNKYELALQTTDENFKKYLIQTFEDTYNNIANSLITSQQQAEENLNILLEQYSANKDLMSKENIQNIQSQIAENYARLGMEEEIVNLVFSNAGYSTEEANNFRYLQDSEGNFNLNALSTQDFNKLSEAADIYGISLETLFSYLITYGTNFNDTIEKNSNSLTALQQKIDNIKESLSSLTGIIDSLKSGKELTEEQIAELKKLENEYDFLDNIINKNSDDYINALNQIQEIEEAKLIALEEEQASQLKITAEIDVSEMTSALEDFLDADYETTVAIKADIDSDFERAVDILETSKDLASKIGDNFIVSANDLSELGAAFPGVLDNIEYLENGTIKLSQQSVEMAKNAAKAKIKESNEVAIAHIQDQIIILENEKAAIQQQLDIIKNADETEIDLEKKTQTIKQAVEDTSIALSAKNADTLAKIESERLSDSLIATSTSQDQFYENHVITLENADKAMADWADNARKYIDYGYKLTDIKPVAFTSSSTSGTKATKVLDKDVLLEAQNYYNRHDINDEEDAQALIDKYLQERYYDKGLLTENDIDEIILQLQSALESRDYLINLGKAQIEEIKASQHEIFKSWDSVAQGLGLDGAKEAELLELLDEEYDRYHDINIEIQKITNSLSKLEKQQDKLLGQDLIQNLEEQLELLEKQKAAQEVKLIIAKQEQEELKRRLTENYGAAFTGDTISNYKALYTEQFNKILEMQKAYNNMSKEEQEKYEKEIEAEEKKFEKFKELLEEYENLTYEEIQNIEEEIQDSIDRIVEYQVEMFTFDINFKIDSTEFAKEFNEFKKRFLDNIKEDDFLGNALANLANFGLYYDANSNGLIQGLTTQINDTINQIKQIEETGTSSIYGNNRAKAMEDLKSYGEELMKQLENVQELVDEIKQSYLDMMDEAQEKFDEQVSMYEYIAELVNSDMNIVKLLYGEDSYKEFERFYDVMKENHLKNIDFQRQQTEFWYEQMNAAEEGSEAWETAKQNYLDSLSSLNAEIEAAIQNLLDSYENTINRIFDDLNKSLTGGMGLDHISQEWELMNEVADQYLDTTNAAFEIRQLERKWIDAINNSSLGAQAELNQLMSEQLEMLREKDKLTQYDVERANALYDIALKEIALKEAQQNKSKMRLRRDAQGNYTYQYVSDEDAVAQAQQELDEARNSLYNMDKDAYKENLDTIYGYYEEFEAAMKELYADASLTEEERQAKKLQLIEYYEQLINNAIAENSVIRANLQDTMETTLGTSLNDFMMGEYIPQWNSGIQQMADKFAAEGGLIPACQEALGKLDGATKEYEESLDELEKSASIDFEAIKDGYNSNIPLVEELIIDNDELITSYESQLEAIGKVIGEVETLISKYQDAKIAADQATEAAYKYWQEQNKDTPANDKPKEDNFSSGGKSGSGSSISGQSGSNGGTGKSAGDGVPTQGEVVTFARGQYYAASDQTGRSGNQSLGEQVTITKIHAGAKLPIHIANSRYALGWVREDQLEGFRTGGYTGEWTGDNGRLGVLHKKELILNQQDTSNILNAVHIARTMSNILDSISIAARARMSSMSAGATSGFSTLGTMASELQQNVTIHADFPNATNHSEIEEAFNNLLNTASQYAFRNGRG